MKDREARDSTRKRKLLAEALQADYMPAVLAKQARRAGTLEASPLLAEWRKQTPSAGPSVYEGPP